MEARPKTSPGSQSAPTAASPSAFYYDSDYARIEEEKDLEEFINQKKEALEAGDFGSVSEDIRKLLNRVSRKRPIVTDHAASTNVPEAKRVRRSNCHDVCCNKSVAAKPAGDVEIITIDSDDEENGEDTAISSFQDVVPKTPNVVRGYSKAAQAQIVAKFNLDGEDSGEDMSISPLRDVFPTSPYGQNPAEECSVNLGGYQAIDSDWKSGSIADDIGCDRNETFDSIGGTSTSKHLTNDIGGNKVARSHIEIVEKVETLVPHHDICGYSVTSNAAAQVQTVVVLDSDREDSDMSISPLRDDVAVADLYRPLSADTQAVGSIEIVSNDDPMPKKNGSEHLANDTVDIVNNDDPMPKKKGSGHLSNDTVEIANNDDSMTKKKGSEHLSNDTVEIVNNDDPMPKKNGSEHLYNDTDHKENLTLDTSMTSEDPMLWKSGYNPKETESDEDGLGDIWKEMSMALEHTENAEDLSSNPQDYEAWCEHDIIHKEDIGDVCRICGVITRDITSIVDIQFIKAKRSGRTYLPSSRNSKNESSNEAVDVRQADITTTEICPHPRHRKLMKAHQVEGFNFLCSNLVSDDPGGCILAHAPGSGKTFMIISFMQSFLAKYPNARPLVVLPKTILHTWRKEFETWRVEDFPIYDFYAAKAENRAQQLDVLKKWVDKKSVLLLGYQQLSSIICDHGGSPETVNCQKILLQQPSLLVLDEGHTPRNENTDVLQSLAKIQTPRKIVLSGTLYQNHVEEVFNVLNLVRPKFLKLDTSKPIVRRILSKAHIPRGMKQVRVGDEGTFCKVVEYTLQQDTDFKSKTSLIHDLREMTNSVLHYYKGDFLDELPGLVDLTVVLNLSNIQRKEVENLKKLPGNFKKMAVGSAVYLHPKLKSLSDNLEATGKVMDELVEKIDIRDGVKAKFLLNLLSLCEKTNEKVLIFSQYLTPLKFLERLLTKEKKWSLGREMFMVTGKSEKREKSVEDFNNSEDAKVFFGSIKACGEGISLVGGSRVIVLDVHLNPSITRQAIGRAFRPGQKKVVYVYRLIAAESPEEEDYHTCFRKEVIAKMWFEWNEFCGFRDFKVEPVEVQECGDRFMEDPRIAGDVRTLYRRYAS